MVCLDEGNCVHERVFVYGCFVYVFLWIHVVFQWVLYGTMCLYFHFGLFVLVYVFGGTKV